VLLIEAILAKISKTKLTGAIVDEAIAIRHGALFVIFESGTLEAGLYTFPEF
jgi:hypothetical protein